MEIVDILKETYAQLSGKQLTAIVITTLGAIGTIATAGFSVGNWSIKRKVDKVETEKATLQAKVTSLEGAIEKAKNVEAEKATLETKVGILEADKAALETRLDTLNEKESLSFERGVYWLPGPINIDLPGQKRNHGPFCTRCWEGKDRKISLQKDEWYWHCSDECGFQIEHHQHS